MKLFLQILLKGPYNFFMDNFYRQFIKLAVLYGGSKRYERKIIRVLDYKLEVPDTLSFIWQFKEIFVDGQYKFVSSSNQPLIYDCGANLGLSIIYFKRIFPEAKIKAFEPNPYIFEFLKSNLETNEIKNVDVRDEAVWIHGDEIELTDDKADAASIVAPGGKRKVKSTRLKSLLEKENAIHFLKIDIEGAEAKVIKDCRDVLSKVENIFIEYHSFIGRQQELDQILNILCDSGFRYFIKPAVSKKYPFINKANKSNTDMDAQFNIYAYKAE